MTPLRKRSGKRVFPLADTLRFLMFPSLRVERNIQFLEDNCKYEFIRVHYIPEPCSIYSIIVIIIIIIIIGFESNLNNNAVRKKEKYLNLIKEISRNYRYVKFVNLSMSSLGVFSDECSTFLDTMNDIGIDKKQQLFIIKKMIKIAIRATYYIFCCRNRNWDSPDLMQF